MIGVKGFPPTTGFGQQRIFRIVEWVLAEFIGAVANMAGRRQVIKIDRVKWVFPLGQIVIIGFPLAVVFAFDIADTAEWTFALFVDR